MASIASSLRAEDVPRAGVDQLLEMFDLHGKYLLSERIPRMSQRTTAVSVSVSTYFISFGKGLNLELYDGSWYVSFSRDVFTGERKSESDVCCIDVELHRVQDVNDILPYPWRYVVWKETTRENLREPVSFKLLLEFLPQVMTLVLGSGKYSFIGSVRATIGTAVEGFTQKVKTYNIRVRGSLNVLRLCDVMAVGDDDSTGIPYADALAVIKAHVPDGYKFQKGVAISDTESGYLADPTVNDQIPRNLILHGASKVASYPSSLKATHLSMKTRSFYFSSRFLELEKLMNGRMFSYMKAGKLHSSLKMIRSCVIDSHFAAFHITALLFPNVEVLFNSDELLKECLAFINCQKYPLAKVACLWQLKHVKIDYTQKIIDFYGNVNDHIPLFQKLVCAEMPNNQINMNNPICEQVFSKFNRFGKVLALGDPADPTLILGYILADEPLLFVEDHKKRIFELQFLLLGKDDHMTMCFRCSKNEWKLYDNDQAQPSFNDVSFDNLKTFEIFLAGYVNITQAREYKLGQVTSLLSKNRKMSIVENFSVLKPKMEQFYKRLRQWIDDRSLYIKDGDSNPFRNTCVLDCFLAVWHITYIVYPNIADLFNGNDFFRKVISLLIHKKFNEARCFCVDELGHGKNDLFGFVNEYLPLIRKLVWPGNLPNDSEIIRKIKEIGSGIVLGDPSDPPLILVHREVQDGSSMELPCYVNDDEKKRIFVLISLLIGKDQHMTMCFRSSEETWLLYDNNPEMPSFQHFDIKSLKDHIICLAGYVNVTQAQEYKLGIAETGEGAGLSNQTSQKFYSQQSALDVEMEDLSFTVSVPIAETGEGVGTRPFHQNNQDILPEFINQEKPMEDVEMLSCSSSDSD